MNKSAFLNLIQQVSNISDQQTEELEKVAATFPYCQTAHLLLAKSAYDKGSMLSTQRLRRASSYATDRQLLKRVIYTSPAPEPVFVPAAEEAAAPIPAAPEVTEADQAAQPIPEEVQPAAEVVEEPETFAEVAAATDFEATAEEITVEESLEEDQPEQRPEESYSELSMLLTINSLGSSSTDLLAISSSVTKPDATEPAYPDHLQETEEALAELELEEEAPFEEVEATAFAAHTSIYPLEEAEEVTELVPDTNHAESIVEESAPAGDPEEAEIHYTFTEIDRLYMEDALGYWMGSSRLGEVLQLKDDYTRPRPQGFHPELILEYSKTHELEKAIQPSSNALSGQLDIIDQFLKLNPRLKTMVNVKMKTEPQEDLSLKSSKIKKGMASESLAYIFLKQGKTKKAIKIYELLILKSPEKKAYFAEQIEKLQNID